MKILLLTFNFGKTSSGKTTERIVDGLHAKGHEVEVLCAKKYTASKNYVVHVVNPKPLRPSEFFKRAGNFFTKELNYIFWELRAKQKGSKIVSEFQPDILYSRGSPVASMTVGNFLKKKFALHHVIHFADPIPATADFITNGKEKRKLLKTIKPIIFNADKLSFVTKEMGDYQNLNLKNKIPKNKIFISPNPKPENVKLHKPLQEKFIFLYLGTFSPQRNPEIILKSFLEFSAGKKDVEFHIYGGEINRKVINDLEIYSPQIKVFGPTSNIYEIFKNVNVLVDVDPVFNDQIFISGKLMEYLSVNRYILSISPENSPARGLLKDLSSSVFFAKSNMEQIVGKMDLLYQLDWDDSNFAERQKLDATISFQVIIKELDNQFQNLINPGNGR